MIILKYLNYWALFLKYRWVSMFRFDVGVAYLLHVTDFADTPIGSPVNPAQLCCQFASVYRDSKGCLSARPFCSLAEYWLREQQTLQVIGPALCLRFCCAWIIEFFCSDFCCYHPLARHTQSHKQRAPIWAAQLSSAMQNHLHTLSNKSSVFCVLCVNSLR